ncbi:type II toxin-antitoxin system RelE/ParE family toxin [Halobacteria archaeon AArc-m2/3/4]|uniref:Type II toxin-antitoxin system RelE/ParE family toxin n=1 Tax=Natronoglomus mannanivorans TaxID=2979990 RepID=A0ABT2QGH6_9EURY|nr:type II toxin-antitoxin system RelE/ParE family toxin [Halobacteria archaeon AArc-m2/3/4]
MGPTTNNDDWEWVFSPRAEDQFAQLDSDSQERIISKLDDVVSSEWREPADFLEPLTNSPFQKLRIGTYRLGCRLRHEDLILRVESVRKRDGAYTADD